MKVFLIGFPKAGTCTINRALRESGINSIHQSIGHVPVAAVLYRNLLWGEDVFNGLGDVEAITQPDVCFPARNLNYWPQLDFSMLRVIHEQHPECRLILNTRDIDAHIESIMHWNMMPWRVTVADVPGLPSGFGGKDEELRRWILGHYANVEAFGIPYAEVRIDDPDAREQLSRAIGHEITWWGVENANERQAA